MKSQDIFSYFSFESGSRTSELRRRTAKREKGNLVKSSEQLVSPPRAFSSGYSLATMTEYVVDIDPYESTYL